MERINELSTSEKLLAGGGVLMLIASFLPWYSFSAGPFDFTRSGWQAPGSIWSVLAILLCLAMGAVVIAQRFGNVQLPDLGSITWAQAFGGASAAVVVLMLLKAWRILAVDAGGFGWGFIIALIAAGAVVTGGYLRYTEEQAGVRKAG